jgi:rhamnosyltransferase
LNLLYDVGFNREVAEDAALYWTKEDGNLAGVIDAAEEMSIEKNQEMGEKAKKRIRNAYSWEYITGQYEKMFLDCEL